MRSLSASGFCAVTCALAGFLAVTGATQAADYNSLRGSQIEQSLPPPPDMSSNINWGGFYFGGTGGLSQSRFSTDKGVIDLANGVFNNSSALAAGNPGQ
ncbi:MAG: hypothetical protein ACRC56_01295, partial [Bosea sp. (in: a-proteobacteria)]